MSKIVTFYSYKGGVGRTAALANIAVLLAKRGKRVLTIDWDLEAPGLDHYFDGLSRLHDGDRRGLAHLLAGSARHAERNWRPYVVRMRVEGGSELAMISSGHRAKGYADLIRTFSWPDFFATRDGGQILDLWRTEWKAEFDIVLIDSRTGITDAGGVCTVFMPDMLVFVFGANRQSFDGGLEIVRGTQLARRHLDVPRPPLAVVPVPGRFDGRDEVDEANSWLAKFAVELKPYYDDWLPAQFDARRILEVTKVPYVSRFSFGEPLSTLTHSITDPELPGFYLNNIARLIESDFAGIHDILGDSPRAIIADLRRIFADPEEVDVSEVGARLDQIGRILPSGPELCEVLLEAGNLLIQNGAYELADQTLMRAAKTAVELPPDNPLTLATLESVRTNAEYVTGASEVESLYREYIDRLTQQTSASPVLVGRAHSGLGQILLDSERAPEAEEEFIAAANALRSVDAVATIGVLNNLGDARTKLDNLDQAESAYREALSIAQRLSRPDDLLTMETYNRLAATLLKLQKYGEAEWRYRDVVRIAETRNGPEDSTTIVALNNLATVLREMGAFAEAIAVSHDVIQRLRKTRYFPNSVVVWRAYTNLTQSQVALGDRALAEQAYRELIDEISHLPGNSESSIARASNALASLLREGGDTDAAEAVYSEVLRPRRPARVSAPIVETFAGLLTIAIGRIDLEKISSLIEQHPALASQLATSESTAAQRVRAQLTNLGVQLPKITK